MIEFRLKIDSGITRVVVPLITQCYSACRKRRMPAFPYLEEMDDDLADAWHNSLVDDFANDRQALARLLNNPRFAHGYVELSEADAELVMRAITEVRLYIRERHLPSILDADLESGEISFSKISREEQSFYLAYLVLAEVQEGLIYQLL